MTLRSKSAQQTLRIGRELGKRLNGGEIVALQGALGSGKTIFVRGLAQGLGIRQPGEVRSPTFNLIQEHRGSIPLCHVDLYRLSAGEVRDLGLEEYWGEEGGWVTAIEWADKARGMIPRRDKRHPVLWIRLETASRSQRDLILEEDGHWRNVLEPCRKKFQKKSWR